MSDSATQQESKKEQAKESLWDYVDTVLSPHKKFIKSAVRTQELDDLAQAIALEDQREVLAEVRKKQRSKIRTNEEGLLEYHDEDGPQEMGDIHLGPKIEVRQVERSDTPPTAQPVQRPANGNGLAKLAIGAAAALGLTGLGGLGMLAIAQLFKQPEPQPVQPKPPVVQPGERTKFWIE